MIGVCTVLAVVVLNSERAAGVMVQAGDVKDSRTTGKFFANLEVELKLLGDDLEGAKGYRCSVTTAIDDTGRNLIKEDKNRKDFSDIDNDNPNNIQVTIQLKNPARKATTVKEIAGEIDIFKPGNDPTSVVTITNLAGQTKTLLKHPTLSAAKISIMVLTKKQQDEAAKAAEQSQANEAKTDPEKGGEEIGKALGKAFSGMFGGMMGSSENSMIMQIKDPQSKLLKIEFLDASGKVIRPEGCMRSSEVRSFDFPEPLPQEAQLRIYVATAKSFVKAPFTLRDVFLP